MFNQYYFKMLFNDLLFLMLRTFFSDKFVEISGSAHKRIFIRRSTHCTAGQFAQPRNTTVKRRREETLCRSQTRGCPEIAAQVGQNG